MGDALRALAATGPEGFEGLIAFLLGLVLEEEFFLSRAGTQRGADAANRAGTIAVEAKRYGSRTPRTAEVLGYVAEALQERPHLEVFVLASTRTSAQLRRSLDREAEARDIDIIALDLDGNPPLLAAACASHWDAISARFGVLLDHLTDEEAHWIKGQGETENVQRTVGTLKRRLLEQTTLFADLAQRARARLEAKGGLASLVNAIERPGVDRLLDEWWNGDESAARLEGPEGHGKSWAAMLFARRVSYDGSTLVLWLDSLDWTSCDDLESALRSGLASPESDATRIQRALRRVLRPRHERVLLVLDGANEHGAVRAARRILDHLITHAERWAHLRVLFTTRPLEHRSSFPTDLWVRCRRIEVPSYGDVELRAALARLEHGLRPEDLPDAVRALASIPLYAGVVVALKERLGNVASLTKEQLVWEVLLHRIKLHDAQVQDGLGWHSDRDAAVVLARWARSLSAPTDEASAELLRSLFRGSYAEVRYDLEELGVAAETTPVGARLGPDHFVLGWALFLLDVLRGARGTARQLKEELTRILEPGDLDDLRTQSLLVAYQLAMARPEHVGEGATDKRAALLAVWIPARNSRVDATALAQLARTDLGSYTTFVELFYESLARGDGQRMVIDPLGRLWQDDASTRPMLREVLRRWLLLAWPINRPDGPAAIKHRGYFLPLAENREQLRLTSVALSILSLRPDATLLESVAVCAATASVSRELVQGRERPIRFLDTNLGYLMRWGYTEEIADALVDLARAHPENELLLEGVRLIARPLSLVDAPDELVSPPRQQPQPLTVSGATLLMQGELLFLRPSNTPRVDLDGLGPLAVRTDLPDLREPDVGFLKERIRDLLDENDLLSSRGRTAADRQFLSLLPWLARQAPDSLAALVAELKAKALTYVDPMRVLVEFTGSCAPPGSGLADELLATVVNPERIFEEEAAECHALVLELADDATLVHWLERSADEPPLRDTIGVLPVPWLLRLRRPSIPRPADGDPAAFAFGCDVLSWTTGEDDDLATYARDCLIAGVPDERGRRALLALFARAVGPCWFERLWEDSAFRNVLERDDFWTLDEAQPTDSLAPRDSYEDLLRSVPQDLAGQLILNADDPRGLARWGQQLLGLLDCLVDGPPDPVQHRGCTRIDLGDNGRVVLLRHEDSVGTQQSVGGGPLSTWGVDQADLDELVDLVNGVRPPSQDGGAWRKDVQHLQHWEHYDLWRFAGEFPLASWAEAEPDTFGTLARRILERVRTSPHRHFHAGRLLELLLRLLLPTDPVYAFETHRELVGNHIHLRVCTQHGIEALLHDLWDLRRCATEEHGRLRARLFLEARNDLEIQHACIAALVNGAEEELWNLLTGWLAAPHARERALTVAALPWIANDRAIDVLRSLADNDPTFWIRRSAESALHVALGERSCRALYRSVMKQSDPVQASALLQRLRPALSGTAVWWRQAIEDASEPRALDVEALCLRFWTAWESVPRNRDLAQGRDLNKYRRGERLDTIVAAQMAPLWNP